MRPPPSPDTGRSKQVGLPPMVEELLVEVVTSGFIVYCCGPKAAPNALLACYEWEHCVDLITIRDFDRVTTARVAARGTLDIFAPQVVVRTYQGPPQQALRALLDLVHPAHPDAPFNPWRDIDGSPIPQQCRIEQVEVSKNVGALPSRLHQQGQVVGRGQTRLIVQFDHENDLVRIRPHVVRVLTTPGGC